MSNLAHKLLDNPGLIALTVLDEQKEVIATLPFRKIKFAFFQDDFQGGKIAYWHVMDPKSPSFMSTLSFEGLKDWGII